MGTKNEKIRLECRWPTPAAVINKDHYLPLFIDDVFRMDLNGLPLARSTKRTHKHKQVSHGQENN